MGIHIPVVGAAVMLAGMAIDSSTLIPIGSALSVGAGVWYLSTRLQRIEDRQEAAKDTISDLKKAIGSLPCKSGPSCEHKAEP
jgi:hypothetical protein